MIQFQATTNFMVLGLGAFKKGTIYTVPVEFKDDILRYGVILPYEEEDSYEFLGEY